MNTKSPICNHGDNRVLLIIHEQLYAFIMCIIISLRNPPRCNWIRVDFFSLLTRRYESKIIRNWHSILVVYYLLYPHSSKEVNKKLLRRCINAWHDRMVGAIYKVATRYLNHCEIFKQRITHTLPFLGLTFVRKPSRYLK